MKFSSICDGQELLASVQVEQLAVMFDSYDTDGKDVYLQKGGDVVAMIECNNAREFKDFQKRLKAIGVLPHKAECPF